VASVANFRAASEKYLLLLDDPSGASDKASGGRLSGISTIEESTYCRVVWAAPVFIANCKRLRKRAVG